MESLSTHAREAERFNQADVLQLLLESEAATVAEDAQREDSRQRRAAATARRVGAHQAEVDGEIAERLERRGRRLLEQEREVREKEEEQREKLEASEARRAFAQRVLHKPQQLVGLTNAGKYGMGDTFRILVHVHVCCVYVMSCCIVAMSMYMSPISISSVWQLSMASSASR